MTNLNMTPMDLKIAFGLHYVVLASAYLMFWFLCLFCLLPIGLGSERDPETGAPLHPQLGKKALWATGISLLLWLGFYLTLFFGWVRL